MLFSTPLCSFSPPQWLIISDNVPRLMYYTHFFVVLSTLLLAAFVLLKGREKLESRIFFYSLVPFWLWLIFNVILFASNRSDVIMYLWSLQILIEPLPYAGMLYLTYVFIEGKDLPFAWKIAIFSIFLPVIASTLLFRSLSGFDLTSCLALETADSFYPYVIEIFFSLWIIALAIRKCLVVKDKRKRKEIAFLATGIVFFLLAFASGNIIGSLTEDWNLAQVGLFGVPVFLGFLAYSIVEFKTFDIKLLRAQALVVAMIVLIGSQFFFIRNRTNMLLTGVTLVLVSTFGWWLVRSVKKEDEQREQLELAYIKLEKDKHLVEKANRELKRLDEAKTEFINIASHQLRTPVSVIQGTVSMMLDGDLDKMAPEGRRKFYESIWSKTKKLQNIIHDVLNATSFSNSKYSVMDQSARFIDLRKLLEKVVGDFEVESKERELELTLLPGTETVPEIKGQEEYLEEVFVNLINNAVKYTPSAKQTADVRTVRSDSEKGRVMVSLGNDPEHAGCVLVKVRDNGIGIPKEAAPKLFQKFSRADNAVDMYTDGTGLGLFIVKEIVEGHGGRVWFESEAGKGTTFFVSLPIVPDEDPNIKDRILNKGTKDEKNI